ncbi:MAG: hypothetical protein HOP29_11575 [Phycisphaerales bacterium]|nr:hypothetical protein [Phycisphaerales bacterium]
MVNLLSNPPFDGSYVRLQEWYWLVPCTDTSVLVRIMQETSIERVVFFAATSMEQATALVREAAIQDAMVDDREDTAFVKRSSDSMGFVFYSCTHDNLEIIGTRRFITDRLLKLFLHASPNP